MAEQRSPEFLQNARKPQGSDGEKILEMMNEGHHKILSEWGLSQIEIEPGSMMLDIGCGGGANLRRLLERCPDGHVTGVDYSEVSVRKSIETNLAAIEAGRCEVLNGDVRSLPFPDGSFDLITAFETIYFWPDIEETFREVRRVMKEGGMFFICNESDGRDESSVKNARIIEGMTLYTPETIEELLKGSGFSDICHYGNPELSHIVVTAMKDDKTPVAGS